MATTIFIMITLHLSFLSNVMRMQLLLLDYILMPVNKLYIGWVYSFYTLQALDRKQQNMKNRLF